MLPAVLSVLAVSLLVWLGLRQRAAPEPVRRAEVFSRMHAEVARPAEALEYASDGLPIHPRGSAEPEPNAPLHPHGFTPVHERIYRENGLIGQLDGAMDLGDVQGMRRLLAQYRDEYPEDSHEMQVGYRLIADCLEFPDDVQKRAAAQRYYDTEIQSGLRRYIRRHCLDAAIGLARPTPSQRPSSEPR
jgi:hypothetical protein